MIRGPSYTFSWERTGTSEFVNTDRVAWLARSIWRLSISLTLVRVMNGYLMIFGIVMFRTYLDTGFESYVGELGESTMEVRAKVPSKI